MDHLAHLAQGCVRVKNARHVKVFGRRDVFAGWPFNNGFEQYGDGSELVVSYSRYWCKVKTRPDGSKAYWTGPHPDSGRRRSTDGGKTWKPDPAFPWNIAAVGFSTGNVDLNVLESAWKDRIVRTHPIDPRNRDHGLTMGTAHIGGQARSFVFSTHDRGRSWSGPSFLPMDGVAASQNRPPYLVRPDGAILTFPTVSQRDGHEGRVFTYISFDGGVTWAFLSILAQNDDYMLIMPTAVNICGMNLVKSLAAISMPL